MKSVKPYLCSSKSSKLFTVSVPSTELDVISPLFVSFAIGLYIAMLNIYARSLSAVVIILFSFRSSLAVLESYSQYHSHFFDNHQQKTVISSQKFEPFTIIGKTRGTSGFSCIQLAEVIAYIKLFLKSVPCPIPIITSKHIIHENPLNSFSYIVPRSPNVSLQDVHNKCPKSAEHHISHSSYIRQEVCFQIDDTPSYIQSSIPLCHSVTSFLWHIIACYCYTSRKLTVSKTTVWKPCDNSNVHRKRYISEIFDIIPVGWKPSVSISSNFHRQRFVSDIHDRIPIVRKPCYIKHLHRKCHDREILDSLPIVWKPIDIEPVHEKRCISEISDCRPSD